MNLKITLFGITLSGLFILSCSDEIVNIEQHQEIVNFSNDKIVYPLSLESVQTRSSSFETSWENYTHVTLPSGTSVVTPWCTSIAPAGDIPREVMLDVKVEDGWELIAHTMTSMNDDGHNYLVFHNYLTGILKVFYYLEQAALNNMGIWRLEFLGGSQKYLNFQGEVADPLGYDNGWSAADITNLTTKDMKPLSLGWNCFQTELAYDPNPLCTEMRISATCYNLQNLNLDGEYQSSTNGLLITRSTSNIFSDPVKGAASLIGNAAESWFANKYRNGNVQDPNIHLVSTRAIGGTIVTAGAQYLFKSLVSRFDKQNTTTQEIQLQTNGTITLNGTIDFVNQSPVKSVTISCSPQLIGKLGAWNIQSWPIANISRYADLHSVQDPYFDDITRNYITRGMTSASFSLILNPKLEAKCTQKNVGYEMHSYSNPPSCSYNNSTFNRGGLGQNGYTEKIQEQLERTEYEDNYTSVFKDSHGSITREKMKRKQLVYSGKILDSNRNPLQTINLSEINSYYGNLTYQTDQNIFMKISSEFTVSINGKQSGIVSVKTFLPRYEWE